MKTAEYTKAYQNIALLTAVAAGEYWTINDVIDMRELKRANVSNLEIAQLLGRSYYAVSSKLHLVGMDGDVSEILGARRNRVPNDYGTACSECFVFHAPNEVECA